MKFWFLYDITLIIFISDSLSFRTKWPSGKTDSMTVICKVKLIFSDFSKEFTAS